MTASFLTPSPSAAPATLGPGPAFPADLTAWVDPTELLSVVQSSAARSCGASWTNLVGMDTQAETAPDDLLVLTAYCYLRAIYHSIDVIRQLEQDPALELLRLRLALEPDQVRRFRRRHRRSVSDCLTRSLVALWKVRVPQSPAGHFPGQPQHNRLDFGFLEPFYLQAQDRVDRAVVLDSMALDY